MERVVPWAALMQVVEPYYPMARTGRPPFGIETMLRVHYMKKSTAVDATLIAAPSSTKNASGERDPEMKQSKKGKQWFFGMKAHIGADAESGLVHTVRGTAGSVNDVVEANSLLHGQEDEAWGDAGSGRGQAA